MRQQQLLENKVCLVTGGTRGIGRAIAEMLLAEGAMVVVCGRWPDSVTRAVSQMETRWPGKVKGKAADVSEHEDVGALFKFMDQEKDAVPATSLTSAAWRAKTLSPGGRLTMLRSLV